MPRNGSSVYSLPAGNPVIPGTVIATTWANTTLTDIATALTNSLSTDGSTASVSLSGKTMSGGTFSGPSVTGILTLTGGQAKFPAVAIPSADANTLDDYEEGTWTPTLTCASVGNLSIVYSIRTGEYTKVGDLVHVSFRTTCTTFTWTTSTGAITVTGLPFTPLSNAGASLSLGFVVGSTGTANDTLNFSVSASTGTVVSFNRVNFVAGTTNAATISTLPSGTTKDITGSGTYKSA